MLQILFLKIQHNSKFAGPRKYPVEFLFSIQLYFHKLTVILCFQSHNEDEISDCDESMRDNDEGDSGEENRMPHNSILAEHGDVLAKLKMQVGSIKPGVRIFFHQIYAFPHILLIKLKSRMWRRISIRHIYRMSQINRKNLRTFQSNIVFEEIVVFSIL